MQHWSKPIITKRNKLQAKKLSQIDEKTVNKGYLYAPISQNYFLSRKIIH